MAVRRLLAKSPLGPEEIDILAKAYEETLHAFGLVDRNDPLTEIIAKKVIEIGQTGLRDPSQISAQAFKELGPPARQLLFPKHVMEDVPGKIADIAWQTFLVLHSELGASDSLQGGLEEYLRKKYAEGTQDRSELLNLGLVHLREKYGLPAR